MSVVCGKFRSMLMIKLNMIVNGKIKFKLQFLHKQRFKI